MPRSTAPFEVDPELERKMQALRDADEKKEVFTADDFLNAPVDLDPGEIRPENTDGLPQASDLNLATNVYVGNYAEKSHSDIEVKSLQGELSKVKGQLDLALAKLVLLGNAKAPATGGLNTDGSYTVNYRVSSDYVPLLTDWNIQAGLPLAEFISQQLDLALEGFLGGQ